VCGYASGKCCGDQFEDDIEVIALDEPVLVAIPAVQGAPFHWAFAEDDFLGGVSGEGQARYKLVLQVRADGGFSFVKIAAGIFYFDGSGADFDAVDLDGCTGRFAGNAELCSAPSRLTQGA
jgi:hypothetical protein